MKAKRLCIVCLMLVLVVTLVFAVACNKHTHEYTKWAHSETQHWKVCPEDNEADESTMAGHNFTDGICECGFEQPSDHEHSYTKWAYDDTQHWKVCPDDNVEDISTRANHNYIDYTCECGAIDPDMPVELDDREFYVVGGGMGDLKDATWSSCAPKYQFIKAEEADEKGNTVYTFRMKLYSGDEFKIIQPTTISGAGEWNDSTVFTFYDFDTAAVTGVFKDGGGANITVEIGADGIYDFTIRTKKGGDLKENKLEFKLVERIPSLEVTAQYEMYLVGSIASHPTNKWPSQFSSLAQVTTNCVKMELQEDGKTFSVEVTLITLDAFKVWNYKLGNKDAGYYPTGVGGDLTVSKNGTYIVSWVIGEEGVSIKEHEHSYTEWGYDADQHWKFCAKDNIIDANSYEAHEFDQEGNTCVCGAIEQSSCEHPQGGQLFYTATTVPTPEADGGELDYYCPDCGAKVGGSLSYVKGTDNVKYGSGSQFELDAGEGNYYIQSGHTGSSYFWTFAYVGFRIEKAGTYTLTFTDVYGGDLWNVKHLWIGDAFISDTKQALINEKAWNTSVGAKLTAFQSKLAFNGFVAGQQEQFVSMTLTVTNDLLSTYGNEEGILFVKMGLERHTNKSHSYFLLHLGIQESSAANINFEKAVEVAMLPRDKEWQF